MSKYTVSEPRLSVDAGSFTHSGRGGAGNTFRVSSTGAASTSRPASYTVPRSSSSATQRPFHSGIGGAGNRHKASERAALDLAEDFARAQARDAKGRAHVGVGGAGNVFRRESGSGSKSHRDSVDSGSSSSGVWGRLSSSSFTRH